jgi:transcriptional regulator with XRE-family HTH domain
MLTIKEIQEKLKDRNLAAVARNIGYTRAGVHKLASGKSKKPTYELIKKLSDYLEE